jgi:hypothetical protein
LVWNTCRILFQTDCMTNKGASIGVCESDFQRLLV